MPRKYTDGVRQRVRAQGGECRPEADQAELLEVVPELSPRVTVGRDRRVGTAAAAGRSPSRPPGSTTSPSSTSTHRVQSRTRRPRRVPSVGVAGEGARRDQLQVVQVPVVHRAGLPPGRGTRSPRPRASGVVRRSAAAAARSNGSSASSAASVSSAAGRRADGMDVHGGPPQDPALGAEHPGRRLAEPAERRLSSSSQRPGDGTSRNVAAEARIACHHVEVAERGHGGHDEHEQWRPASR